MDFDAKVLFNDNAVLTVDGSDTEKLAHLGDLVTAAAQGIDLPIDIEGGRTKFVGDIRSMRIEARF